MAQWFAAKERAGSALVFFRMGDFYELFFEDAEAASEALGLALTQRGEHQGVPIPMCGVPHHACEAYLARLIRRGFRVAICEQTETPEHAKARKASTIRREVVRVVTPGTATEEALLDAARPAWLLALAEGGAAWLDVSTGAFHTAAGEDPAALIARLRPAEILAADGRDDATPAIIPKDPARRVADAFGVATLDGFGQFSPPEIAACAMALDYVRAMGNGQLPRLSPPLAEGGRGRMLLDAATRRSLEILESPQDGPTLLAALDRTLTGPGARELAARLAAPLDDLAAIRARHDHVALLLTERDRCDAIRAALKGAPDMARALARLSLDRFAPRDLGALRDGLARAAALAEAARGSILPAPAPLPDLAAELARALAEELPARLEDGGVVGAGYDGQLDALRRLRDDARGAIAAMQMDLAQAWGVAALKIRHHQQLGFLAEVPSAAGEKLLRAAPNGLTDEMRPIHRQSMANAHRFTCAALAALDRRLSEAGEEAQRREKAVVQHLRRLVLEEGEAVAEAARAMAELDVLAAAAELAREGQWCRPEMTERPDFTIIAGRHPVVEKALREARGPAFVPNGCDLSPGRRLCLLTGPNMAGKSTFLRQNALFAVMAQAGLFLPAEAARLGLVDRLFSRVGAADDLAGGRSTFMVEMSETAAILNLAGPRSLVVLDEVGRGTATWDGLAIATAVLEALHDRIRCRTLFATHFHELTVLAHRLPELRLARMEVREWRGEVVFRHSVGEGAAEKSWGIHVAKLAGVPTPVLRRSAEVLAALEARAAAGEDPLATELPLFAPPPRPPSAHPALEALRALDPDSLSPREAQEALYHLRGLADGTEGQ
ncbi:DNA mismatch repair protein MutS [Sabulicella rubraurantiaca]|uniref:DNA mismatch repair protein MutS n=1 Tax=Sabulicella rubraurantiaca TaxID=2811429 RepID=UPI001A9659E3|nr:DNA mismatch repair protein MutS [Sabulicella rubraurantiaca]